MAVRYINNKRQSVDVLITSNTTITVAGNNSVSDIAIGDQILTGATIKQLFCASPSGNGAYWEISRGSNVVFTPDSTAYIDFAGNGMPMNVDQAETIVCNLFRAGDDEGSLWMQLHKQYDKPDNSEY